MKALPKRKGNGCAVHIISKLRNLASMKALPKRKGNEGRERQEGGAFGLNESPSQKEGKLYTEHLQEVALSASMKALPKRKGNLMKNS